MSSPTLDHRDLGQAAAAAIRQRILSGELRPGDRLVEAHLAEEFGTSRGPIRDALVRLENSGLVVARPRRGRAVKQLLRNDVAEIYSLRRSLEGLAVAHVAAAPPRTETVERLQRLLAELDDAHARGHRLDIGLADMALHREIITASDHRRLARAWERLADETLLLMTALSSLESHARRPAGDHRAIVQAIVECDPQAAASAMHDHLTMAERTIIESLSRDSTTQ